MRSTIICILLLCTCAVHGQSGFHNKIGSGPHPVGFQLIKLPDSSRVYGKKTRELAVSYWYPAADSSGTQLSLHNYLWANTGLGLNASEAEKSTITNTFLTRNSRYGAAKQALSKLLETKVLASHQAVPKAQEFPLVIVLQGGGRPSYTQFILNEWLASNGYHVAAIPDLRSAANRKATTALSNAEALSLDLKLVLQKFQKSEPVAVIGFSKAGEAILLRQMHDAAFNALIFLDAQPGEDMISQLKLHLKQDSTPTLAFFSNHQGKMDFPSAQNDSTAFDILGGNLLKIRLMEANHGDLTSAAILGDLVDGYNRWPSFGNSRLSHEVLCLISLIFLDHYLKQIPGEERVEKLMKALPPQFISMHRVVRKH